MKALLLINEKSGAVQSVSVDAISAMAQNAKTAVDDLDIEIVHGEAEALIEAARERSACDVIAAAGGDGTQAAIASVLMNSDTAQLPLPCGTMNMLCRDLGIPLDIEEALRAGLQGRNRKIDVGLVNDRIFLNNIVFGAYADIAEAREELRDAETLEDVSYGLVTGANALFHAEPVAFRLELDGAALELKTNTIAVSNNAISGADNLTPYREHIDEGDLVVYLTKAAHGGDFAGFLADFAAGAAEDSEEISVRRCKRCVIHAGENVFSYSVDGDPVETSEAVAMEIKPSALLVRTPVNDS